MNTKPQYNFFYTCPNCSTEIPCNVYKGVPAKVSGPPDDCYPEEYPEYDGPEECEECGHKIEDSEVITAAIEKAADDYPEPSDDPEDDLRFQY